MSQKLTTWCMVIPEKLTALQTIKKFTAIMEFQVSYCVHRWLPFLFIVSQLNPIFRFSQSPQYPISHKPVWWELCWYMWTDGRIQQKQQVTVMTADTPNKGVPITFSSFCQTFSSEMWPYINLDLYNPITNSKQHCNFSAAICNWKSTTLQRVSTHLKNQVK